MRNHRRNALGRGLGALLSTETATESLPDQPHHATAVLEEPPAGPVLELPLRAIDPNPRQPRSHFDDVKLQELADSIKTHGVLQPLIVTGQDGAYTLIAGERRLRAAEKAGLEVVPVRVLDASDVDRLELAIIENVQREDLNPVEEARGYQALIDSFHYRQEDIALRVGKSRVAVANSLRLLKLPEPCLHSLEKGEITPGHARAILSLPHATQQELLRKEILERDLTVRQAEERARAMGEGEPAAGERRRAKQAASKAQVDLDVHALEEKLTLRLGCKVRLRTRAKGTSGTLEVAWSNLDDLDRILELLQVSVD